METLKVVVRLLGANDGFKFMSNIVWTLLTFKDSRSNLFVIFKTLFEFNNLLSRLAFLTNSKLQLKKVEFFYSKVCPYFQV